MSHNYQLNWATAGDGKPRVLELWDGGKRICAITSPDESDESLQLDLEPLIEAANESEDCQELKDRIRELETEIGDANDEANEAEDKVSGLEDKIEELEGQVDELKDRIAELENGEGV